MDNIVDFPKRVSYQLSIKCWMVNNEIADILSKYEEEIQFVAVVGVLLEMLRKSPSLEPALMKLLENRRLMDDR